MVPILPSFLAREIIHLSCTHRSFFFADARDVEVDHLERLVALNKDRLHRDPCSDGLLKKIQDGLLVSSFTPRRIKKLFSDSCL